MGLLESLPQQQLLTVHAHATDRKCLLLQINCFCAWHMLLTVIVNTGASSRRLVSKNDNQLRFDDTETELD
jgi:hypothetical protein